MTSRCDVLFSVVLQCTRSVVPQVITSASCASAHTWCSEPKKYSVRLAHVARDADTGVVDLATSRANGEAVVTCHVTLTLGWLTLRRPEQTEKQSSRVRSPVGTYGRPSACVPFIHAFRYIRLTKYVRSVHPRVSVHQVVSVCVSFAVRFGLSAILIKYYQLIKEQ